VHLATGNYNQQTARLYEDLSLFTAREDVGEDATSFFNMLTGYSAPLRWNRADRVRRSACTSPCWV